MCTCSVASVMSDSLQPYGLYSLQAPLSMGFSRQEYWSGLPCPPLGDLSNPGIEPVFCIEGGFFTAEPPGEPSQFVPKSPLRVCFQKTWPKDKVCYQKKGWERLLVSQKQHRFTKHTSSTTEALPPRFPPLPSLRDR